MQDTIGLIFVIYILLFVFGILVTLVYLSEKNWRKAMIYGAFTLPLITCSLYMEISTVSSKNMIYKISENQIESGSILGCINKCAEIPNSLIFNIEINIESDKKVELKVELAIKDYKMLLPLLYEFVEYDHPVRTDEVMKFIELKLNQAMKDFNYKKTVRDQASSKTVEEIDKSDFDLDVLIKIHTQTKLAESGLTFSHLLN